MKKNEINIKIKKKTERVKNQNSYFFATVY